MRVDAHTPGPWQRSGVRQSITDFKGHAVGPDGDPVVVVPYNEKQHSECLANASLIAAAPELLAALRKASQLASIACDWHLEEVEIDGEMVDTHSLGDEFEAAIAKAEGRT